MPDPVCGRCGGDKFIQLCEADVRVEFTRRVLEVKFHDDGSFSERVSTSPADHDAEDSVRDQLDNPDVGGYACARCDYFTDKLIDLVIPALPKAGDRYVLPDGRTRAASRIFIGHSGSREEYPPDAKPDHAARIFVSFHNDDGTYEAYMLDGEGLERWEHNPGQLELLEAA